MGDFQTRKRIEEIFHHVAGMSTEARRWYYSRQSIDAQMSDEVEALLVFDSGSSMALNQDIGQAADQALRRFDARGLLCGRYRLGETLGRGGMGTVYLAERVDGEVEQSAAVKLLRPGVDGAPLRQRFLAERQILAGLSHPNIARLLDAGHSEDGQPYLVMEYVPGQAIDIFTKGLSLRRQIRLFVKVCAAVQYLHRNLVVHRDLKPANILVTADGHPKLLDFGIAKMLDLAPDPAITTMRMLTPDYSSPEQVCGGAITTAADIYSLGAVLYKILTGKSPHQYAGESAGEIALAISAGKIAPPSKLAPGVKGDLDTIVMKALRKEPQERYASVEQFAEDLENYLELRPIRARQGDAWYHARKFSRRYWLQVAAAGLALAGLTAGVVVANRQRALAERRFVEVRQLATQMFEIDKAIRATPGVTRARQLIVSTSLHYLQALGAEVHGDPDLAFEIGAAYLQLAHVQGVPVNSNLGQFAQAEESLRKADSFVESALRTSPGNRGALLTQTTITHDRMVLAGVQNRQQESLAATRKAAAQLDRLCGGGHLDANEIKEAAFMYGNVAATFDDNHMYEEAIRYARRALEVSRTLASTGGQQSLAYGILANSLRQLGDLDGALTAVRQSRTIQEALPDTGKTWQRANLVLALWREADILGQGGDISLNRTAEALALMKKAFRIVREVAAQDPYDDTHRRMLSEVGGRLADLLRERDPRRALAVYDQAIDAVHGVQNANVASRRQEAVLLAGSSYALQSLHQVNEAGYRIEAAIRVLQDAGDYPAQKIDPASEIDTVLRAQAEHYRETGEPENAVATYRNLLEKLMASQPDLLHDLRNAASVSQAWAAMARALRETGDTHEAVALERQSADLWRQWDRKLPKNVFVVRRLAEAERPHIAPPTVLTRVMGTARLGQTYR